MHKTTTRSIKDVPGGLVGTPDVRGEPTKRPEAHGVIEPWAQYLDGRLLTIEGNLRGGTDSATIADHRTLVAAFVASLSTDATLLWEDASGMALQTAVRFAGMGDPKFTNAAALIEYQLHLRCPDPIWLSQTENSTAISAPTASTGGMDFPITFPIPFGTGVTGGNGNVTNAGNQTAWPVFTVQGPVNGPVIYNTPRGETLSFTSLTVATGDVLTVTTNPRTRAATVAGASVLGSLDYTAAKFPGISAASTESVGFYGVYGGYGASTSLVVSWRDSYIS